MALHVSSLTALLGILGTDLVFIFLALARAFPKHYWECSCLTFKGTIIRNVLRMVQYIILDLCSFMYFVHKMYLFANYCLVFSLFTDKNLWCSSQRRREAVVGMLMAALANIMGIVYYVSTLCQKLVDLFAKCINC